MTLDEDISRQMDADFANSQNAGGQRQVDSVEQPIPTTNSIKSTNSLSQGISDHRANLPSGVNTSVLSDAASEEMDADWANINGSQELGSVSHNKSLPKGRRMVDRIAQKIDINSTELSAFGSFLYGNNAQQANQGQSVARGFRKELTKGYAGVRQRFHDGAELLTTSDEEWTGNPRERNDEERKADLLADTLDNGRNIAWANKQAETDHPNYVVGGEIAGAVAEFVPLTIAATLATPATAVASVMGLVRGVSIAKKFLTTAKATGNASNIAKAEKTLTAAKKALNSAKTNATVPLIGAGAAYGATRPQEDPDYTYHDVVKTAGTEAVMSLAGGKLGGYALGKLSDFAGKFYKKHGGGTPTVPLIRADGTPSQELDILLYKEGIKFEDLTHSVKESLKNSPDAEPDQVIRAATYEDLGIDPSNTAITGKTDFVDEFGRKLDDPDAVPLKNLLLEGNRGLEEAVDKFARELGDPDVEGVARTLKEALEGRASGLREASVNAVDKTKRMGAKLEQITGHPFTGLTNAWKSGASIKRSLLRDLHSDVKETLMKYNVIPADESFSKLIKDGDVVKKEMADMVDFKEELKSLIDPTDISTKHIIDPLIDQVDELANKIGAGTLMTPSTLPTSQVGGTILTAQGRSASKLLQAQQDFNALDTVKLIIGAESGVAGSKEVFSKIINTSARNLDEPSKKQYTKNLTEVVKELGQSGAKGTLALKNLQSATVLHMLESATKRVTGNRIKGQQFDYKAFSKAFDGVGSNNLEVLFKGEGGTESLKFLKQMYRASRDSQKLLDGIPRVGREVDRNVIAKGVEAALGGLFQAANFVFVGSLARAASAEFMQAGKRVLTGHKLRIAVAKQIKAKPELRGELVKLTKQYPALFAAMGIATTTKSWDALAEDKKRK